MNAVPKCPGVRAQAYIFDMDDTLVASAALWKSAEQDLLEALGLRWDPELARSYKGMNALDVAATIHAHVHPKWNRQTCQQVLRNALIERFEAACIEPIPGAMELVRRLHGHGPLAVASGSPLCVIEQVTHRLGIRSLFAVLVSSESVARGKPHPDIFLAAAQQLGAAPAHCLVFEDSLVGVQAARAAGMRVLCVPSCTNANEIVPHADAVLSSWADAPAYLPIRRNV